MHKNGAIVEDIATGIRRDGLKLREATGMLSDKKVPLKAKGKFHKTVVRPEMLYKH